MIYFIIPLIIVAGYLLGNRSRNWTIFYWFCCAMLIIFAGARWETGTDWIPYSTDFAEPGLRGDFEIGYVTLVRFVSYFTSNYTVFLLFTAFVSTTLVFVTCYRVLGPNFAAILVFYSYYYLGSWLGAERRQYAIGLCFLAILWIKQRRLVLYLCTVCLAGLFHTSALIFLPAYWIYHMRRKTAIWCSFGAAIATVVIAVFGMERIVSLIFTPLQLGFVSFKVLSYATGASGEAPPTQAAILFGLVKRLVVLLFFLLVWRKRRDSFTSGLLKLYCTSVAFYVISMLTVPMFSVMTIYYSITEVLLIAMALSSIKLWRPIACMALASYAIFQVASILHIYWSLYIPYYSVFDHTSR